MPNPHPSAAGNAAWRAAMAQVRVQEGQTQAHGKSCGGVGTHIMKRLARNAHRESCVMKPRVGWRDQRTGRFFGFQSETQRENFMAARARFSNGPKSSDAALRCRQPLGRALQGREDARQADLLPPRRGRGGQTNAVSSCAPFWRRGTHSTCRDKIGAQPAARSLREPGRTIMLVPADEAACQAWAARQVFQLGVLDRDFPARDRRLHRAGTKAAKSVARTTQWMNDLDRRAIAELEATGIPWASVEQWLDALEFARSVCGSYDCEAGLADVGGRMRRLRNGSTPGASCTAGSISSGVIE